MTDKVRTVCPLCAIADYHESLDSLSGRDLRALWNVLGVRLTPDAWGALSEDLNVILYRCNNCRFEFFDSRLAGNATFYKELQHEQYYTLDRPEFARTLAFAKAHNLQRVLDVGCGTGGFLDLAKKAGLSTSGVELNQSAAEEARRKGHAIFDVSLDTVLSTRTEHGFDLVTLFQVLEHVPMPVDMIRKVSALLRPGGFLAVSVPSSEGILRVAPLDPHQWPPHHVTRWRNRDFQQLAQSAALLLYESSGDRLLGSALEANIVLQCRLVTTLGRKPRQDVLSVVKPISLLYRKTGMKYFLPRWGHSRHAILQRPTQ